MNKNINIQQQKLSDCSSGFHNSKNKIQNVHYNTVARWPGPGFHLPPHR